MPTRHQGRCSSQLLQCQPLVFTLLAASILSFCSVCVLLLALAFSLLSVPTVSSSLFILFYSIFFFLIFFSFLFFSFCHIILVFFLLFPFFFILSFIFHCISCRCGGRMCTADPRVRLCACRGPRRRPATFGPAGARHKLKSAPKKKKKGHVIWTFTVLPLCPVKGVRSACTDRRAAAGLSNSGADLPLASSAAGGGGTWSAAGVARP